MGSPAALSRIGESNCTPSLLYAHFAPGAVASGNLITNSFFSFVLLTPSSYMRGSPDVIDNKCLRATLPLGPAHHSEMYAHTGSSILLICPSSISIPARMPVIDLVLDIAIIGTR